MNSKRRISKKRGPKQPTGFTLAPELIARLRAEAERQERSASFLAGLAIAEYLDRCEANHAA